MLKEKISGAVVREEEPVSLLSESFSQYPVEVQEAINRLKSQYDLEDGDIETVVNNLWSDPPHYYEVTQLATKLDDDLTWFLFSGKHVKSRRSLYYSPKI